MLKEHFYANIRNKIYVIYDEIFYEIYLLTNVFCVFLHMKYVSIKTPWWYVVAYEVICIYTEYEALMFDKSCVPPV